MSIQRMITEKKKGREVRREGCEGGEHSEQNERYINVKWRRSTGVEGMYRVWDGRKGEDGGMRTRVD